MGIIGLSVFWCDIQIGYGERKEQASSIQYRKKLFLHLFGQIFCDGLQGIFLCFPKVTAIPIKQLGTLDMLRIDVRSSWIQLGITFLSGTIEILFLQNDSAALFRLWLAFLVFAVWKRLTL